MAKGSKKDAIRVLYVEDNEHDTRAVFRALEKSGRSFEITHCTRAEEAIKRLEREPSAHDILLTDYMLPGMSGLELCKTLVGEGLSIPIVILTGTGTEAVAVEALKSGAFDYVVKDPSRGYIKLLPVVLGEVVAKHADKQARAKAEAALRASEERFRRIFEESPMGVVMSELDGKIVAANGQLSKITGYSQEELLEMHSSDLTHPDDIELTKAYFKKIAQTGSSPGRIEKRYISKSGEVVWVAVTGGLLDAENGGQQYAFGMIENITELKEVEDKLRQAQKMEAVGQLTGGVAHEFNNLLMVVLGSLELMQDRVSEDEEALELLASALRGARRGASLTQSLLAFSRKQQLEVGEVDLNRLVLSMTDFLKRTLGATIALETKLADDLWRPAADAGQIEAAILNFAINARDAMPDGGNITVRTENQKVDSSLAAVHDVEKGDYVSLEVTDTGHGMEDYVLKHALEPFFTTKDVDKGTGLGLSVVYGFVRQSGGFMEITSKVGKGTTARLCLPRYREADQKRKSADASE